MLRYSINIDRNDIALAQGKDIDASYKDLTQVCGEIRYMRVNDAVALLERVEEMTVAVPFRRFNKRLGSRHELGGKKGAYPAKAARETRKVLLNAIANAANKGFDIDALYVVHASANKTHIERRSPSKGSLAWGRGRYGFSSRTHSDLEYAKVEIGVASKEAEQLTGNMQSMIKLKERAVAKQAAKMPSAKASAPAKKAKQERKDKPDKQEKQGKKEPKETKEANGKKEAVESKAPEAQEQVK